MANCAAVTLLLGHFDRKVNNLVKRSGYFLVFNFFKIWRILTKSSETFSPNYLYKLFQGVLVAKNIPVSCLHGTEKDLLPFLTAFKAREAEKNPNLTGCISALITFVRD